MYIYGFLVRVEGYAGAVILTALAFHKMKENLK